MIKRPLLLSYAGCLSNKAEICVETEGLGVKELKKDVCI